MGNRAADADLIISLLAGTACVVSVHTETGGTSHCSELLPSLLQDMFLSLCVTLTEGCCYKRWMCGGGGCVVGVSVEDQTALSHSGAAHADGLSLWLCVTDGAVSRWNCSPE